MKSGRQIPGCMDKTYLAQKLFKLRMSSKTKTEHFVHRYSSVREGWKMNREKRRIVSLIAVVCVLIAIFTACVDGNNGGSPESQESLQTSSTQKARENGEDWSIYIYLCGTDLESGMGFATENLNEMLSVTLGNDVNVLIQTGGTELWQTSGIPSDKISRFVIEDGQLKSEQKLELASMGDENTLYDFLSWGVELFPAKKMAVILWDHGGGSLAGVISDELYEHDGLTLNEMKGAFSRISNQGVHYELIGVDACLMATLETAYVLSPYANYFVASEELEPGGGWAYEKWLQYLVNTPSATGADVGKVICDSYFEKCKIAGFESMATLSCSDLRKVPALVQSFENMSRELKQNAGNEVFLAEVARGAERSERYGGGDISEGFTNQLDLFSFMQNISGILPDQTSKVISYLSEAVDYNVHGSARANSHGLSVFFPLQVTLDEQAALDLHSEVLPSESYRTFVNTMISEKERVFQDKEAYVRVLESPRLTDDGSYSMTIDPMFTSHVGAVSFSLYKKLDDNYVYLGSDSTLLIDWQTGFVSENIHEMWPTLNEQYVSFYLVDFTDEYILYSIPILLNGEETNLRVEWIWDAPQNNYQNSNGAFTVLGVWSGIDGQTGMSSRNIQKVHDGDVIQPIFFNHDDDGSVEKIMGNEFVVVDGLQLAKQNLAPGDYWYLFNITDIYGNTTQTDFLEVII